MVNKLFYIVLMTCIPAAILVKFCDNVIPPGCITGMAKFIKWPNTKCNSIGCGRYNIERAYWSAAGNLTINNEDPSSENAYSNCAYDLICAKETITNYMRKYAHDCNGDNIVDCYDYFAIHLLGLNECRNQPIPYASQYSKYLLFGN